VAVAGTLARPSPRSLLSSEEFPTLAAVSERWRMVEAEMREYLATLSEEALEGTVPYLNFKGEPGLTTCGV